MMALAISQPCVPFYTSTEHVPEIAYHTLRSLVPDAPHLKPRKYLGLTDCQWEEETQKANPLIPGQLHFFL